MKPQDYEYLYQLEEHFWWFAGMREITASLLNPILSRDADMRILDAGCGTGGMLSFLQRYSGNRDVTGIDFSPTALQFCRQRGQTKLARGSIAELPFTDSTFDLVASFDVLQHVFAQGDLQAIAEFQRVLRPGGIAFVRVAAYQWLRSGHDDAIAVQRRYTLPQLSAAMRDAGFRIRRATYANTLLFPVAAVKRLLFSPAGSAHPESEVKPWPKGLGWVNGLLTLPLKIEAQALKGINLPFGVSAICIGEKLRP
jgi:SAM-dependent methyltransferase